MDRYRLTVSIFTGIVMWHYIFHVAVECVLDLGIKSYCIPFWLLKISHSHYKYYIKFKIEDSL